MNGHHCPSSLKKSILLAIGLACSNWTAAVGLGPIQVNSYIGQPIRADIRVDGLDPSSAQRTSVKLASTSEHQLRGIKMLDSNKRLRFSLVPSGKNYRIVVTSDGGIREPFLNFLLTVSSDGHVITREYAAFLSPDPMIEAGINSTNNTTVANNAKAVKIETKTNVNVQQSAKIVSPPPQNKVTLSDYEARQAAATTKNAKDKNAANAENKVKLLTLTPANKNSEKWDGENNDDAAKKVALLPSEKQQVSATAAPIIDNQNSIKYGPVRRGETLYSIAKNNRPSNAVSIDKMMEVIFKANPNAFSSKSLNSLQAGATLHIPNAAQLAQILSMPSLKKVASKENKSKPQTVVNKQQEVVSKKPQPVALKKDDKKTEVVATNKISDEKSKFSSVLTENAPQEIAKTEEVATSAKIDDEESKFSSVLTENAPQEVAKTEEVAVSAPEETATTEAPLMERNLTLDDMGSMAHAADKEEVYPTHYKGDDKADVNNDVAQEVQEVYPTHYKDDDKADVNNDVAQEVQEVYPTHYKGDDKADVNNDVAQEVQEVYPTHYKGDDKADVNNDVAQEVQEVYPTHYKGDDKVDVNNDAVEEVQEVSPTNYESDDKSDIAANVESSQNDSQLTQDDENKSEISSGVPAEVIAQVLTNSEGSTAMVVPEGDNALPKWILAVPAGLVVVLIAFFMIMRGRKNKYEEDYTQSQNYTEEELDRMVAAMEEKNSFDFGNYEKNKTANKDEDPDLLALHNLQQIEENTSDNDYSLSGLKELDDLENLQSIKEMQEMFDAQDKKMLEEQKAAAAAAQNVDLGQDFELEFELDEKNEPPNDDVLPDELHAISDEQEEDSVIIDDENLDDNLAALAAIEAMQAGDDLSDDFLLDSDDDALDIAEADDVSLSNDGSLKNFFDEDQSNKKKETNNSIEDTSFFSFDDEQANNTAQSDEETSEELDFLSQPQSKSVENIEQVQELDDDFFSFDEPSANRAPEESAANHEVDIDLVLEEDGEETMTTSVVSEAEAIAAPQDFPDVLDVDEEIVAPKKAPTMSLDDDFDFGFDDDDKQSEQDQLDVAIDTQFDDSNNVVAKSATLDDLDDLDGDVKGATLDDLDDLDGDVKGATLDDLDDLDGDVKGATLDDLDDLDNYDYKTSAKFVDATDVEEQEDLADEGKQTQHSKIDVKESMEINIELAESFMAIGNKDRAKTWLEEVMKNGDENQRSRAKELLDKIDSGK